MVCKNGTTIYDEFRIVRYTNYSCTTRIRVNLPEDQYKIVGGHQLPGSSMYNDTHPENRESKLEYNKQYLHVLAQS
jgi:hypothetical protein